MRFLTVQLVCGIKLKLVSLTTSVLLCATLVTGGVEIVKPYHPLYVKAGNNLTIACESGTLTDMIWMQQTPNTSWADEPIRAVAGSNIVIQSFREEPSGFTRSTLIKRMMSISDRGTYICKDSTSNYAVWVTVLQISAQILTPINSGTDPIVLGCDISGFDSNFPMIDYDWTFNGSYIQHSHAGVTAPVRHSPIRQATTDKYRVTLEHNRLRLEINDPSSLDGGSYDCVFTLGTNLGPVTFTETLHINGSLLTSRSLGSKRFVPFHIYVTTFVIAILTSLL